MTEILSSTNLQQKKIPVEHKPSGDNRARYEGQNVQEFTRIELKQHTLVELIHIAFQKIYEISSELLPQQENGEMMTGAWH